MYFLNRPSQKKFYLTAGDSGSNMNGSEHYAREVDIGKTEIEFYGGFRSAFPLHLLGKVSRSLAIPVSS